MNATNKKVFPFGLRILQGLIPFKLAQVPAEIIAGTTLAALAIPEVMGYTKIAGTPIITGLYTLLIPMTMFALFGSSRHLVVGADSATAAILASSLVGFAAVGTDEYLALASLLALMVGGLLILASTIGLGFMADFLSRTVLVGFLIGVGVQVALGAIAGMVGLSNRGPGTFWIVWNDLKRMDDTNLYSLAIALAVLAVITVSRLVSKRMPGAMIAVVGSIVASWTMNLEAHVAVLGSIPTGFPALELPDVDWSFQLIWKLFPIALAMFAVVLAQSAATSRAYAERYNEKSDESIDLVGLGLANVGAGLSGTFVVNGSPTKTEMVDSAGGRTQLSHLITALIVLITLLFLTKPLGFLPEAVLSSVVFLIGIHLIDIKGMREIFRQRRSEFWVALITALVVIFLGVEQGIVLAILLSLIVHTRHGYKPKTFLLTQGGQNIWHAQTLDTGAQVTAGLIVYRFTHSMYYANAPQLSKETSTLVQKANPNLRWLCIDISAVDDVDFTAEETLRAMDAHFKKMGVRLVFAQILVDANARCPSQLRKAFGKDAVYATLEDVVDCYKREYK